MDITGFAKVLGGAKRLEGSGANRPTNVSRITGTAVSDSEDGKVLVRLDAQVFSGDGSQYVELATSDNVREGDSVYVDMVGADGKGKSLMISGSIGSGDRQQSEIDDAARAAAVAWDWADEAHEAAEAAQESADEAAVAASAAQTSADEAAVAAGAAQTSANAANAAANSALTQLSFVEDVAGTLDWIQRHGAFTPTADTTAQAGKVYFELVSGEYVPVAQPSGDPSHHGWYELDVTDSQTDYIMAHLAVTSAGLWVLPSGVDSQSGERYSSGYKLLLASDGARIYDGSGQLVATYGESIEFSSSHPQHIGGENAHITYYDSDDDGVPDSIYIGGSNVTIGGKTLSQFTQAIEDATAARRYAEDVPIVTLSSTNGTVFKRNAGVSTTIVATIFTPGGRIDNATELRRRFGASAYLEWGWRDVVTDAAHVLVVTDPRIIMGGFGLVVSPGDIDAQAVITCSLNY